jgi:hypothetical protein
MPGFIFCKLKKTELYNFSFQIGTRFGNDRYQMACYFIKKAIHPARTFKREAGLVPFNGSYR